MFILCKVEYYKAAKQFLKRCSIYRRNKYVIRISSERKFNLENYHFEGLFLPYDVKCHIYI